MNDERQLSSRAASLNPEKVETTEKQKDDIFQTEEVIVEEMAIDGICGVY